MYDTPTQSHMAIEVGGQDPHMGCPIAKPVLSTEPEPLQCWGYQPTPCFSVAREVLGRGGIFAMGTEGRLGMWLSWQSSCLASLKPWVQPLPLHKAGDDGALW